MKMFIDRKDSARKDNGIRGNDIEKSLKNRNQLALPMLAFGEPYAKLWTNVETILKLYSQKCIVY